jgi:hypothetical protein
VALGSVGHKLTRRRRGIGKHADETSVPWLLCLGSELRGVAFRFVLRLLIDASVWLDMATRREGRKWIVPLRVLKSQGKLELLVPALSIEEFDRNRLRSESAVTTSMLDRLRQLRQELREYAGDKHEHIWLTETAQHIPTRQRDGTAELPGDRRAAAGRNDPRTDSAGVRAGGSARPRQAGAVHLR